GSTRMAEDSPQTTVERARDLRRRTNIPERRLWNLLRDRRLASLKFRRQHPVGPFYVDFCCAEARLVVELDGMSHDHPAGYDRARQADIEAKGFHVFRVSNDDALQDPEAVLLGIARAAGIDIEAWMAGRWKPEEAGNPARVI